MIKDALAFLCLAAALSASGANVAWGEDCKLSKIPEWNCFVYNNQIDTFTIHIGVLVSGGSYYLDSYLGLDENRAAVASKGDVVSSSYAFNGEWPMDAVDLDGEGIYMAYKTMGWVVEPEAEEIYAYGWVRLYIGEDGEMYGSSAFDLDGGAMYVGGGAVPEPTSGLFVLLGLCILGLRRIRSPTR